ncbi:MULTISPECIES: ornithine cyclodeaminase family protein [unclassified Sphingomonas]|uniref:ornithine cyclodeaminase family protein n=1 Tax=unclassified Sphingomonas TaxID=196159 RepID=UPI0006F1E5A0|nr:MULTISPECIES: ornithine cyclodeaminase family protein [unclassified Sphingomonas]KQM62308.1 ornithine cyclodeaminase [Sphingomonas sp. Leaf16]KQN13712.1 ornithine cyclodeaminase [Sphingomonas sp. Leaf29]KQN23058.1 ornithine cyclodeaminase [Sphingomonas sp. Leaf32]
MTRDELAIFDSAAVRAGLGYGDCIDVVRTAMMALSAGTTRQLLRTMLSLGPGRTFAQMPGALGEDKMFGTKTISVFADPQAPGKRRHRGLVVLFEPVEGRPVAVADAEEITHIRTAAATAIATDALARADAATLLIVGTGGQAHTHLHALPLVRRFDRVLVWGRDPARADAVVAAFPDLPCERTDDLAAACGAADVICTLTAAAEPVVRGEWVRPGTHVNLVGSSGPGPVEVDSALVVKSRYIADSIASARDAAAEFLVARDAGLVTDDHIVAEIGEVLLGRKPGRTSAGDITVYKSLGHAVQDLAAAAHLYRTCDR